MTRILLAFVALLFATPAFATTPATTGAIVDPRCGTTVVLTGDQPGLYRVPKIACPPDAHYRIDATAATFGSVSISAASGIEWIAGQVTGDLSAPNITVNSAKDVTIRTARLTKGTVGITVVYSQNIHLLGNTCLGLGSDCIDIASSQDVELTSTTCLQRVPALPTYDAAGKLIHDVQHPDCVQAWSVVGKPPLARITIRGSYGYGFMQGIFFGNVGQGGSTGVVAEDNYFELSAPTGISLMESVGAVVRRNTVTAIAGAKMLNNNSLVRPTVYVTASSKGSTVCGNVVPMDKTGAGTAPCPAS